MNDPNEPRSIAHHVMTPITPARIARQWSAIADDPPRRRLPRWLVPATSAAAVAVMAAILIVTLGRRAQPLAKGAVIERGIDQAISLPDGSRVVLGDMSRVRLVTSREDDVRIELERGDIELAVTHVKGRRFVVAAGSFDVVIVGTELRVVLADSGGVSVSVSRGRVEVKRRDRDEPARSIAEGETWSSAPQTTTDVRHPTDAPAASNPAAAMAPSSAGAPSAIAAPSALPFATQVASAGSKELLEMAQEARMHGRPRDAAVALDALRRRYRGDQRAGLAAFELGRLRMDSFGDLAGALEALDDALSRGGGAFYREDAEARRVAIFDAMGGGAQCVGARDQFLASYPHGVHTSAVAKRCGGR